MVLKCSKFAHLKTERFFLRGHMSCSIHGSLICHSFYFQSWLLGLSVNVLVVGIPPGRLASQPSTPCHRSILKIDNQKPIFICPRGPAQVVGLPFRSKGVQWCSSIKSGFHFNFWFWFCKFEGRFFWMSSSISTCFDWSLAALCAATFGFVLSYDGLLGDCANRWSESNKAAGNLLWSQCPTCSR